MTFRNGHIVILALILLAGCSKADRMPERSGVPVALQVNLTDTKGQAGTTTSSLQTSGIGIFAWRTNEGTYFNGEEPYLENQPFSYDGATSTWKSADVFWPLGSWLSFFAYAPYTADLSSAPLEYPSSDYAGGLPRFTYTPAANPAEQMDLVISAPVLDRSVSEGTVPLTFYHPLTKVSFQARWTSSDPAQIDKMTGNGYSVRIKSLTLNNILGENSLTYTRNGFKWDAPTGAALVSLATASYTLSMANGCLATPDMPDTEVPMGSSYGSGFALDPESVLYLLPQALTPGASLDVVYGLYGQNGLQSGDDIAYSVAIGNLPTYVWPAGSELCYRLSIDIAGVVIADPVFVFTGNAGSFLTPGTVVTDGSNPGSFLTTTTVAPAGSNAGSFTAQ